MPSIMISTHKNNLALKTGAAQFKNDQCEKV